MWAVIATVLFTALLIYLSAIPTCNSSLFPYGECPAKWRHIVAAPINEVGDTLAGLAGVLAFIWLVATVLLQAHELGEQRREFKEQRKATQDMARAMASQAAIFEDEKLLRDENRAHELLNERVNGIVSKLRKPNQVVLKIIAFKDSRQLNDMCVKFGSYSYESSAVEIMDAFHRDLSAQLNNMHENMNKGVAYYGFHSRGARLVGDWGQISKTVKKILDDLESLSSADKQRVDNLRIPRIYQLISKIAEPPAKGPPQ